MPMLKRCCFTRDLWLGTIICGTWTLVWCAYLLGTSVYALRKEYAENTGYSTEIVVLIWITLCLSFLTFLASILLITGVFKASTRMMVPWMVLVTVLLLEEPSANILYLVRFGFIPDIIVLLIVWIILSIINIYCELCAISHYQELKQGRGRRMDYINRRQNDETRTGPVQTVVGGGGQRDYHTYSVDEEDTERCVVNADGELYSDSDSDPDQQSIEDREVSCSLIEYNECTQLNIHQSKDSLQHIRDYSEVSDENCISLLIEDSGVESSMSNEGSPDLTHQEDTTSPHITHQEDTTSPDITLQEDTASPDITHMGGSVSDLYKERR